METWTLVVAVLAVAVPAIISLVAMRYAVRSARAAETSARVAEEALASTRAQAEIAREGVQTAQSVRDHDDRPRFRMTADSAPSGDRWWIEVEMLDGPTRVQARWLHQGLVGGPLQDPGTDHEARDMTPVAERNGPTYLHKGAKFRIGVECEPNSTSIEGEVSIVSGELEPGGNDQPTGRQWPHIENVAAERPPPPMIY